METIGLVPLAFQEPFVSCSNAVCLHTNRVRCFFACPSCGGSGASGTQALAGVTDVLASVVVFEATAVFEAVGAGIAPEALASVTDVLEANVVDVQPASSGVTGPIVAGQGCDSSRLACLVLNLLENKKTRKHRSCAFNKSL